MNRIVSLNFALVAVALGLNASPAAFLLTVCLLALCASLTVMLFLIGVWLDLHDARLRGWFQVLVLGGTYP